MAIYDQNFVDILNKELVPALGCTDPGAFGLTAAIAREHAPGELVSIEIEGSALVVGGIQGVGIPNSGGQRGGMLCAAMGYYGGDSSLGLEVLRTVTKEDLKKAEELAASGKITLSIVPIDQCPATTYLKTTVKSKDHVGVCAVASSHGNVVYISEDDTIIMDKIEETRATENLAHLDLSWFTIENAYNFSKNYPMDKLPIIAQAIELNTELAAEGLRNPYGMQVALTLKENVEKGIVSDDEVNYILRWAIAGADARMGGADFAAMSNAVSGNQGVMVTMAPIAAGDYIKADEETKFRGALFANLMNLYTKYMTKEFCHYPPQCYCSTMAPAAAAAGVAFVHGYSVKEIIDLVRSSVNNIAGTACDGAKPGCAFKMYTGLCGALQAMFLAKKGITAQSYDGLCDDDIGVTFDNLYRFQKECMLPMADVIAKINLEQGAFI